MTDKQYENLMRELAELKEMAWSKETQEQLLDFISQILDQAPAEIKTSCMVVLDSLPGIRCMG